MTELNQARLSRALMGAAISALMVAGAGGANASTLIRPDSLIISSTTYVDTGAVQNLVAGVSKLPGASAGTTVTANSGGALATVFNNASVDSSFGVTSGITLQDFSLSHPASVVITQNINPNIVSTSFSSKSELSLNVANTSGGPVVTFMGYNAGGLGNLDVSNSDTTAYKDTTNPVTSFFAPNTNQTYAFNRDVVQVGATGSVSTTQTLAYGGNNGRAAVLAPNGLYYTVGNSNNGSGTPTNLTTTTGAEVVTPGSTPNSTMIAPTYQSVSGDKAGKDNNFRGLTYFGGNLYVSKGSGSNGIDTVYEISGTPTPGQAATATVSILPGLPTDKAKTTGGNFTPFGLFFANATTLYVADEGTGSSTDVSTNAGLEKWSLVNGTWKLDYTLRGSLIGSGYSVSGTNGGVTGTVSGIKTAGLRDLTGKVNADGTVSLWAVTSTTGGYADAGASPNEIVGITDVLADTSALQVSGEDFSVFDGPQYGVRYGGVAFSVAGVPEPSTWALMLVGLGGLGGALRLARRKTVVAA